MARDLHVCTACPRPHYDNCGTCFGFGLYIGIGGVDAPVAADKAFHGPVPDDIHPCPECGSTIAGVEQ